jgi:predicted DNA-binding transcriptional regulator YafY
MDHFERILGILLVIQRMRSISAAQLARQFHVSTRTIYRDLQTLSALGVPIYTTRGHGGGVRLLEGYFLPPLMFSRGEAIVLLLGLTLLQSLHTFPFPDELKTAMQKLLVAVPEFLRTTLEQAEKLIGFEHIPEDIFHPEPIISSRRSDMNDVESRIVTIFVQAILDRSLVRICYQSPYNTANAHEVFAIPLGLFWDRGRWYLVGRKHEDAKSTRLWRVDRVVSLIVDSSTVDTCFDYTIQELLGRAWLKSAMDSWQRQAPAVICMTRAQAERLQQDWFYQHARFEALSDDRVKMLIGEDRREVILELVRWLGPGAELLEPEAWRAELRAELQQMLAMYHLS